MYCYIVYDDLYSDTIQSENLSQSNESIYKIDNLITKTIEFVYH